MKGSNSKKEINRKGKQGVSFEDDVSTKCHKAARYLDYRGIKVHARLTDKREVDMPGLQIGPDNSINITLQEGTKSKKKGPKTARTARIKKKVLTVKTQGIYGPAPQADIADLECRRLAEQLYPTVDAFADGWDAAVVLYSQPSYGRRRTLLGVKDYPGLAHFLFERVFDTLSRDQMCRRSMMAQWELRATCCEVGEDVIIDLFDGNDSDLEQEDYNYDEGKQWETMQTIIKNFKSKEEEEEEGLRNFLAKGLQSVRVEDEVDLQLMLERGMSEWMETEPDHASPFSTPASGNSPRDDASVLTAASKRLKHRMSKGGKRGQTRHCIYTLNLQQDRVYKKGYNIGKLDSNLYIVLATLPDGNGLAALDPYVLEEQLAEKMAPKTTARTGRRSFGGYLTRNNRRRDATYMQQSQQRGFLAATPLTQQESPKVTARKKSRSLSRQERSPQPHLPHAYRSPDRRNRNSEASDSMQSGQVFQSRSRSRQESNALQSLIDESSPSNGLSTADSIGDSQVFSALSMLEKSQNSPRHRISTLESVNEDQSINTGHQAKPKTPAISPLNFMKINAAKTLKRTSSGRVSPSTDASASDKKLGRSRMNTLTSCQEYAPMSGSEVPTPVSAAIKVFKFNSETNEREPLTTRIKVVERARKSNRELLHVNITVKQLVEKQLAEEQLPKQARNKAKTSKNINKSSGVLSEKLPPERYSWLSQIFSLFVGGDCISHFLGFITKRPRARNNTIAITRFLKDVASIKNKITRREVMLPVHKLSVKLSRLQDQLKSGHEIPFMMKLKSIRYDSTDQILSKKQNSKNKLKTLPEEESFQTDADLVTLDDLSNLSLIEDSEPHKRSPSVGSTRSKRWRKTPARKLTDSSLSVSDSTAAGGKNSTASSAKRFSGKISTTTAIAEKRKNWRKGRDLSEAGTLELIALDLEEQEEVRLLEKMRESRHSRDIIEQIHKGSSYEDIIANEIKRLSHLDWKRNKKKAEAILQQTAQVLENEKTGNTPLENPEVDSSPSPASSKEVIPRLDSQQIPGEKGGMGPPVFLLQNALGKLSTGPGRQRVRAVRNDIDSS